VVRGPGCLFGSMVGLAAGAALAIAAVVGLARLSPGLLDQALRVAVHAGESGREAREATAQSDAPAAAAASPDRREMDLRIRMRHRLRRLAAEASSGAPLRGPVEFTEDEVQAALTDPQGPLKGSPDGLEADLLPGKVRLSWPLFPEKKGSRWLEPLALLEASIDLEPRLEKGRLVCIPVGGKVAGVPVPRRLVADLAPAFPSAPKLPPPAGFAVPRGTSSVEVLAGRLRLEPAQSPEAPPRR
jgi:hypothetical protein